MSDMSQCSSWLVLVAAPTLVWERGIFDFFKTSLVDRMVDRSFLCFFSLLQTFKRLADLARRDLAALLFPLRSAYVRRPDGARLVPVARWWLLRMVLDESRPRVELCHLNAFFTIFRRREPGPSLVLQCSLFLFLLIFLEFEQFFAGDRMQKCAHLLAWILLFALQRLQSRGFLALPV